MMMTTNCYTLLYLLPFLNYMEQCFSFIVDFQNCEADLYMFALTRKTSFTLYCTLGVKSRQRSDVHARLLVELPKQRNAVTECQPVATISSDTMDT